jgi:hypothetical protein
VHRTQVARAAVTERLRATRDTDSDSGFIGFPPGRPARTITFPPKIASIRHVILVNGHRTHAKFDPFCTRRPCNPTPQRMVIFSRSSYFEEFDC